MPEVSTAGEDQRHSMFIARGNDFIITLGTTRLNRGRDAGLRGLINSIAEREKGVRRHTATTAPFARLVGRHVARIEAAHLARSHADDHAPFHEDDRVRLHMLADAPAKLEVHPFGRSGLPFRNDLPLTLRGRNFISFLNQQPAGHAAIIKLNSAR